MNDEKTIFDGENTQYQSHDEEATQYDDAYNNENKKTEEIPKVRRADSSLSNIYFRKYSSSP